MAIPKNLLAKNMRNGKKERKQTFSVFAAGTVLTVIIIAPITTNILHLAISVIRTPRTITVPAIIVTVPTVILARRIVPATWGRRAIAAPRRRATVAATFSWTITPRIEAPRSRRRRTSPLVKLDNSFHRDWLIHGCNFTSIFSKSSRPMRLLCIS